MWKVAFSGLRAVCWNCPMGNKTIAHSTFDHTNWRHWMSVSWCSFVHYLRKMMDWWFHNLGFSWKALQLVIIHHNKLLMTPHKTIFIFYPEQRMYCWSSIRSYCWCSGIWVNFAWAKLSSHLSAVHNSKCYFQMFRGALLISNEKSESWMSQTSSPHIRYPQQWMGSLSFKQLFMSCCHYFEQFRHVSALSCFIMWEKTWEAVLKKTVAAMFHNSKWIQLLLLVVGGGTLPVGIQGA